MRRRSREGSGGGCGLPVDRGRGVSDGMEMEGKRNWGW